MSAMHAIDDTEAAGAWWRHPLVWMVIAGPALVVVAGFVTLWLALSTPDPVLPAERPAAAGPRAALPALAGRNHAATPAGDMPAGGR